MRRLLLISDRFPPDIGGVARSAFRTASRFARLGVETHAFAWTKQLPPGAVEVAELSENLMLHRMGLFANWDLSMQHSMNVIEWMHQQNAFDFCWGHYLYPAGFMSVVLAKQLGIRSIVSARGNDVDRMMFPPGDFARLTWTLQQADAVTAVSEDLARKIQTLVGSETTCRVLHNSVDADVFRPMPADAELKQQLGICEDQAVLGFSSELRHKKGLTFLLPALKHVLDRRSACLLVIGEVRHRDRSLLNEFALDQPEAFQQIKITGSVDEPAEVCRHLNLCDVFLQPSVWDGLPNAVLEAMACQRIVVASDAGGIPEVIENNKSGYMIPRVHLHRLGDAIIDVLSLSDSQRQEIGQAARNRVVDAFSEAKELAALEAIVQ